MIDFQDRILCFGDGNLFSKNGQFHPDRPTALIYASCHGRQLFRYFDVYRREFSSTHNLLRLETAPMVLYSHKHGSVFENKTIQSIFSTADIVFTYAMGERHGELSLKSVERFMKPGVKVITFVAPNFSCLWPMAYGYSGGLAVMDAMDKGKTEEQIWQDFVHGQFDPCFKMRWRIELGRIKDKSNYHDIGLIDLIEVAIKKQKLWLGSSHPGMNVMAHVGNEAMGILGYEKESMDKILSYNYLECETGLQPETDYEFKHYGFTYPIRHRGAAGGESYYRDMLALMAKSWNEGDRKTSQIFIDGEAIDASRMEDGINPH